MNINRIKTISELLTEQMNHWLLFPLPLTVMGIIRVMFGTGEFPLPLWLACSLFPPVFFLIRCKVRHLIPFILLHLAAVAPTFLIPDEYLISKIFCILCGLGYVLYSCILRLKEDTLYSGVMQLPVGIVVSAGAIWLQHSQGTAEWDLCYYLALIAGIALYLIISYMDRYLDFLSLNKGSAGFLPAAEMFHSGMGLVLGYTLFGILILFVSAQFEWLVGILQPLKSLLIRFLRFLFSLLPDAEPEGEMLVEETPSRGEMDDGMMLPEASEPFWLWEVLEAVVVILFFGALLFGIAVLLLRLFQLIRKHLVLSAHGQEADMEDTFDFRERCELEKDTEKKRKKLFESLSARERIRRLYKKRLLSPSAQIPEEERSCLDIYTAREWESRLQAEGMADVYEKARYSGREMTNADVKKMKEACKVK